MKTVSEAQTWLQTSEAIKTILVEIYDVKVGGIATNFYLSNNPFTTGPSDAAAPDRNYLNCVVGGVSFSESMPLSGAASISYGDIALDNTDGSKDTWIGYIWSNKRIKILLGDVTWTYGDFLTVFDGVVDNIYSSGIDRLNITLLNKLERLNVPISETTLGGTSNNKDKLIPLTFGECFNLEPLLTDPAQLEYQVHAGSIEDIIEIRDNGYPLAPTTQYTKLLANGKFKLSQAVVGQITVSVQGSKPVTYTNKIADIIQSIVTSYGPAATRFTLADIDTANFSSFSTAVPYAVGYSVRDRENILEICQRLAQSAESYMVCSSTGLLRLVQLKVPSSGAVYNITANDVLENGLEITDLPRVVGSIRLNYCKNWAVQTSGLAGALPASTIAELGAEWKTSTSTNSTVLTEYKLDQTPPAIDTYLLSDDEAISEAARRLATWSAQRKVLTVSGAPQLLTLELGDPVTVTYSRYGLAQTYGLVIGISKDWVTNTVKLEVLV